MPRRLDTRAGGRGRRRRYGELGQYNLLPDLDGMQQPMYPQLPVTWMPDGSFVPVQEVITCSGCVLYPPKRNPRQPTTREKPPGCRTAFIGGLPENVTEEILRDLFSRCGEISSVRMSQKNFAHIRFELEVYVDYATMLSGYHMKIRGETGASNTGRLHCDYAQARDDTYEWKCQQRIPQQRIPQQQRPPVVHHEAVTLNSESRRELTDLHLRLLELEREEEKKQQLTKDGVSALMLKVERAYSKEDVYVLTLRHGYASSLPKHCIDQGSRVSVSYPINVFEDASHSAVVSSVTSEHLTLTLPYEAVICRGMPVCIDYTESTYYNTSTLKLVLESADSEQGVYNHYNTSTLKLVVESADSEQGVYNLTLRHEFRPFLPEHCIDLQGSLVLVSFSPIVDFAVVTEVTSTYLKLTFQYDLDIDRGMTVFIDLTESTNSTKLSEAMEWLKNVKTDVTNNSDEPVVDLVRIMFNEHQQEPPLPRDVHNAVTASPPCFINQRLDASQRKAVEMALRDQRLTVIHGPPGTGKTTTIVEMILQHVKRGQRVLVCAPSNKAVDNLLEGLWKQTKKEGRELIMARVTRLGHLARMDKKHRQFSSTVRIKKRLKMRKNSGISHVFQKQGRKIEMAKMLEETFVVMSTLTCVLSVQHKTYDLLVIDECAQATEPACWLAIPLARKVLLAGDPWQLPPTILSQEAERSGLAVSLMERQMELHGEGVVHMLDTQYRMHELIQAWSSRHLYEGRLKAATEVCSRLLTELPDVRSTKRTQPTLLLVDTDGCNRKETQDSKSYRNNGEADLVVCHAGSLVEAGLPEKDIGVITPYKQQVKLIAEKMRAAKLDVEVNSVDGYQGREKEAILLSLVRSNERGQVGFVKDIRRLNVAVTRARRHLFIVCDTATVCRDKTIRSLVRHIERSGEVRSAYCDQCPGGKDGPKPSTTAHASDPVLSATGVQDLGKGRPSAKELFEAFRISRQAISNETMMVKRQETGLVHSLGTATLAQGAKESDSFDYGVKVSDSCDSAAKVSVTRGFAAKVSDTRGSAAKVSDTRGSAAKVSDTRGSAAKVSDIRGSAAKVSETRGSAAKVSDIRGSAAKVSDTRGSAAKVSDTRGSAAKVSDIRGSAAKVSDTRGSAAKVSDIRGSAAKVSDTRGSAAKVSDTRGSAAKVSDTRGSAAKVSDTRGSAAKVSDIRGSAAKLSDTRGSAAKVSDIRGSAAKVSDTRGSAAKVSDIRGSAAKVSDTRVSADEGPFPFGCCNCCQIL